MKELYKEILEANASLKTTPVQGKDYVDVAQRIKAFRMVYPDGYITTEIVSLDNGVVIFKAECGTHNEFGRQVLGTGSAYEKENSSFINKTSYIENCETSAVGRALGMAGFGIDTSVCSLEELQNAKLNQDKPEEKITIGKEIEKNEPKPVFSVGSAYSTLLEKYKDEVLVKSELKKAGAASLKEITEEIFHKADKALGALIENGAGN